MKVSFKRKNVEKLEVCFIQKNVDYHFFNLLLLMELLDTLSYFLMG